MSQVLKLKSGTIIRLDEVAVVERLSCGLLSLWMRGGHQIGVLGAEEVEDLPGVTSGNIEEKAAEWIEETRQRAEAAMLSVARGATPSLDVEAVAGAAADAVLRLMGGMGHYRDQVRDCIEFAMECC